MTRSELLQKWKGNRSYTLKLLDALSEEYWDLRPADGVKTYGGQWSHLTTWLRTHSRFVTDVTMDKVPVKTHAEVVAALTDFFDALLAYLTTVEDDQLAEIVKVFYGKRSRAFILSVMDNHLAHHRGQVVVYQRLCGVVPVGYRGW